MTVDWNDWGPPLVVLALGLGAGLIYALKTARDPAEVAAASQAGRETDLQREHEEAVEALRVLDVEREKLDETEYRRQRAELLARGASALRHLEEARAAAPRPDEEAALARAVAASGGEVDEAAVAAALAAIRKSRKQQGRRTLSPEWRGAMWVILLLGLVGGLWWQLGRSAGDRPPDRAAGGMMPDHPPVAATDDPAAAPWLARLEADPHDLEALNVLTEISLTNEDLGGAMAYNGRAMEIAPNDADAKIHRASLTLAIGMTDRALALLDEVLASHPDHPRALVYKGLVALAAGDAATAVAALEKAESGIHGGNAIVVEKLAEARALLARGGGSPAPHPVAAPPAAGHGSAIVAGTIRLAGGTALPADVHVFVSVRDPAGGPPIAARKLQVRSFPVAFRLTTDDLLAMGGAVRELPAQFDVSVRVDLDGDATTREEGMPSWTATAVTPGSELEVRLE